jgi:phenylacetate-CoA ligase
MRDYLVSLVNKAKKRGNLTHFLRYLPPYYGRVSSIQKEMRAAKNPEGRRFLQEELLARTLRYASRTGYGRNKEKALSAYPVLDKIPLREKPEDFIRKTLFSVPAATSGSSGVPLKLKRSIENIAAEQAFLDSLLPEGITFRTAKIAVLRGDFVKSPNDTTPPFGIYRDAKHLTLSFPHLNKQNLAWFVEELKAFQPDVLWVYPTAADLLASLCLEEGITIPIKTVLSSSEMLSPEAFTRLEKAFSATVVDYYGQAERVCLSYQTKPDEAWFEPAYGLVELTPLAEVAQTGFITASVVATGFWNSVMPLVRYTTGDKILYPDSYSAQDVALIPLGLKPFTRILGRESEYLLTPEGAKIQALNNIPREVNNIHQVQFIQHSLESVEIRVLATENFTILDKEKLLYNARLKIPESIALTITHDAPLEQTSQRKTPFVIRRTP